MEPQTIGKSDLVEFCNLLQIPLEVLDSNWDISILEYLRWTCIPRIIGRFSFSGNRYRLHIDLVRRKFKVVHVPREAKWHSLRLSPRPSASLAPSIPQMGCDNPTFVGDTQQASARSRSLDGEPEKQPESSTELGRSTKTVQFEEGSGPVAAARHPQWMRRGGRLHRRRQALKPVSSLAKKDRSTSATQLAEAVLEGCSSSLLGVGAPAAEAAPDADQRDEISRWSPWRFVGAKRSSR